MNSKLVLPALCLGGAAALLVPARPSSAFAKLGGNLSEAERDVRVFDNFLDATANNNTSSPAQFPGWTGAELAVWKGIVEWGAKLHGDGTGDPQSGNLLGDGGANFDAMWAGHASAVGGTNNNVVSGITTCGGTGTLAYTEFPLSTGWRIRFCDEWVWDDGPGAISNRWDIQGVMAHEYGHALGLNHSGVGSATMAPSGSPGQTGLRSIAPDDIAGVQCIYGVASATKPCIVATVANVGANTLTIYGSDFGATDNEVWFTNDTVTATGIDPIVRVTGVSSTMGNTRITVTMPANASPGDVIVNKSGSGGATLSNAFPTDLVGTFGNTPGPNIANVSPSTIEALIPGTTETITITGTELNTVTAVLLDGSPIPASRYTIVGPTTITLDMPQASSLGLHDLGVTDGAFTDEFQVTIVVPAMPTHEVGTGDPFNVVDRDNGLSLIVSGTVGKTQRMFASLSNLPSTHPLISLGIGNNFSNLLAAGDYVIPAAGWVQVIVPSGSLNDPGPGGTTFYSQTFEIAFPTPFEVSNVQSMTLVQ